MTRQAGEDSEPGWWARNWSFYLPHAIVLFLVALGAIALLIISVWMKTAEPYRMAMSKAKGNLAAIAALGSPIADGFFPDTTSINVDGPSGHAKYEIPVSGPKGKGTLHAEAKKSAGKWTLTVLVLHVESTNQRIDLLEAKAAVQRPAYSPHGSVPAYA